MQIARDALPLRHLRQVLDFLMRHAQLGIRAISFSKVNVRARYAQGHHQRCGPKTHGRMEKIGMNRDHCHQCGQCGDCAPAGTKHPGKERRAKNDEDGRSRIKFRETNSHGGHASQQDVVDRRARPKHAEIDGKKDQDCADSDQPFALPGMVEHWLE